MGNKAGKEVDDRTIFNPNPRLTIQRLTDILLELYEGGK